MAFEKVVGQWCDSAVALDRRDSIDLFSRWKRRFPFPDHASFDGSVIPGRRALTVFSECTSVEFYALLEFASQKIPTVFRCSGLRSNPMAHVGSGSGLVSSAGDPRLVFSREGPDLALVDFHQGWSMVFFFSGVLDPIDELHFYQATPSVENNGLRIFP
jgi:hypothetical protein